MKDKKRETIFFSSFPYLSYKFYKIKVKTSFKLVIIF